MLRREAAPARARHCCCRRRRRWRAATRPPGRASGQRDRNQRRATCSTRQLEACCTDLPSQLPITIVAMSSATKTMYLLQFASCAVEAIPRPSTLSSTILHQHFVGESGNQRPTVSSARPQGKETTLRGVSDRLEGEKEKL
eukprot:3324635-Pleurochrysis_carterae.AAC.1